MTWNYSNLAVQTVLSAGIDAVVTSLTVGSISGFPVVYPYTLILDYLAANAEVVNVTAGVGTTLTVTRGQDGTTAVPHATNAVVAHGVVARDLAEPQAHIPVAVAHMAASTNVHGLTGGASVVGTTGTQTLSGKTLDNSNIYAVRQDRFTLQNPADLTKQATFELAAINTGTTRTYTLPNASSTLVDLASAQTLTNKSLDISNGVSFRDDRFEMLDSGDITKRATFQLSGITTGTSRTYTMPDATGTLVDLTTYPLDTAWVTWAPTLTNLTLGNGTVTAKQKQIGKTVHYRFKFKLGTTSAVGTAPRFTLPVAPHAEYVADEDRLGTLSLLDAAVNLYDGFARYNGASTVELSALGAAGATVNVQPLSATVPFTWGVGDSMMACGTYDAA